MKWVGWIEVNLGGIGKVKRGDVSLWIEFQGSPPPGFTIISFHHPPLLPSHPPNPIPSYLRLHYTNLHYTFTHPTSSPSFFPFSHPTFPSFFHPSPFNPYSSTIYHPSLLLFHYLPPFPSYSSTIYHPFPPTLPLSTTLSLLLFHYLPPFPPTLPLSINLLLYTLFFYFFAILQSFISHPNSFRLSLTFSPFPPLPPPLSSFSPPRQGLMWRHCVC